MKSFQLSSIIIFLLAFSTTIKAQYASPNMVCYGDSIKLFCGGLTGCGIGGSTYTWTDESTSWESHDLNPVILPGSLGYHGGQFNVTVQFLSGGSTTGVTSVVLLDALNVTGTVTPVSCNGGNDGALSVLATGGQPAYGPYVWNNGVTADNISGLTAGIYTVTVYDAHICSVTASFEVPQPQEFLATAIQDYPVTSNGGINGMATVILSGGIEPFSYLWNNNQTSATATGLLAGTFTVTVTDVFLCTTTTSVIVSQLGPGPVTSIGSQGICNQSEFTVPVTVNDFNEIGGINLTLSYDPAFLQPLEVTNINIPTTGPEGKIIDFDYLTYPGKIIIGAYGGTSAFSLPPAAELVSITFRALAPIASTPLTWNAAPPNACEYANNLSEFIYCKDPFDDYFKNGSVTINPVIIAGISAQPDVLCFGGNNGSLTVTATGGSPGYSYQWNNGQVHATASYLTAGVYTVTVTDSGGCNSISSYAISENLPITFGSVTIIPANCQSSNGSIHFETGGGISPYTYLWNNGQTSGTALNLSAGNYIVTVTDAGLCTKVGSWQVTSSGLPTGQVILENIVITSVHDECITAQTITAAGNGTSFLVQSGGSIKLIASQNILLLPTTIIHPNGYLHGIVTINCLPCNSLKIGVADSMFTAETGPDQFISVDNTDFFRIYPNPTTAKFALEISTQNKFPITEIKVFGMLGELVLTEKMIGVTKKTMTFDNQPTGIYMVMVMLDGQVGTAKIIRMR